MFSKEEWEVARIQHVFEASNLPHSRAIRSLTLMGASVSNCEAVLNVWIDDQVTDLFPYED